MKTNWSPYFNPGDGSSPRQSVESYSNLLILWSISSCQRWSYPPYPAWTNSSVLTLESQRCTRTTPLWFESTQPWNSFQFKLSVGHPPSKSELMTWHFLHVIIHLKRVWLLHQAWRRIKQLKMLFHWASNWLPDPRDRKYCTAANQFPFSLTPLLRRQDLNLCSSDQQRKYI